MKLRLRYFASLRESLGKSHEDISTDAQTVGQLRDQLLAQGGAYLCLARGKAVRMALNQVMVEEDAAISDNAEVAFFPPVTGG
jgi:molybdopterin synthase sulfur carrier subunit